jgi:putative ABC transport system substrate-binding protein
MRRRDFITFLGGTTAWVATARGEAPPHVIGWLSALSDTSSVAGSIAAFYQGMREIGFVEGKNVSIEYRWADGHYDRLPALAAELVSRNVTVIWVFDLPSAFAAKAATKTIPIVFQIGADPVRVGLVESFNRPNGNLTGMTAYFSVAGPKRVELLHELLPAVNTIAVLGNPSNENFQLDTPDILAAADALKLRLEVLTASTENELEEAFATMVQHRLGALVVVPDPLFFDRREQLVQLAARHMIPAIYPSRVFTDLGGLMSYGSGLKDLFQEAGIYVGKILKGARTTDLPIQQSTKSEMVINLKTARTLDLTLPSQLLALADEVIE